MSLPKSLDFPTRVLGTATTASGALGNDPPAANAILYAEVRTLLREPWNSVIRLVDHQVYREEVAPDGTKYGVETTTMWDHKPGGTLRFFIEVFRYDRAGGWTGALVSTDELREPPADDG